MVAEHRAMWLDIGTKAAFTEPPPESRQNINEMLGRTDPADLVISAEVIENLGEVDIQ